MGNIYEPEKKEKAYVVNFDSLDRLVEDKFLRKVISPCGRLVVYNYTDHCTYNRKWNKHTLNARGSVYEISTGRLVAKAFPKFFNFTELSASRARNIAKQKDISTFEKVDGSLGIVFQYKGEWMVNTRGAFSSDQAVEGLKILREKYNLAEVPSYITLLAEIIYPENQIVVDYGGDRKLVLLSAYNIYSGKELSRLQVEQMSAFTDMPITKELKFKSVDELIEMQKTLSSQEEGAVAVFKGMERVKFKSLEYLKVARLIAYITPLSFWRNMKLGKVDIGLLESLPEELRAEADKLVKGMEKLYRDKNNEVYTECSKIVASTKPFKDKGRAISDFIRRGNFKHGSCSYAILNGQVDRVEKYVMNLIRPKGNEMSLEDLISD